mmetsp:Transcript_11221/g.32873  ORF Transcript_11221/g.32873 Transcript_11221/m.32873 type:complete len:235 (+) Transcript_11221:194-898(+)
MRVPPRVRGRGGMCPCPWTRPANAVCSHGEGCCHTTGRRRVGCEPPHRASWLQSIRGTPRHPPRLCGTFCPHRLAPPRPPLLASYSPRCLLQLQTLSCMPQALLWWPAGAAVLSWQTVVPGQTPAPSQAVRSARFESLSAGTSAPAAIQRAHACIRTALCGNQGNRMKAFGPSPQCTHSPCYPARQSLRQALGCASPSREGTGAVPWPSLSAFPHHSSASVHTWPVGAPAAPRR